MDDDEVAGVPVRRVAPVGAHGTTIYVHGGGRVVGTPDDPLSGCTPAPAPHEIGAFLRDRLAE